MTESYADFSENSHITQTIEADYERKLNGGELVSIYYDEDENTTSAKMINYNPDDPASTAITLVSNEEHLFMVILRHAEANITMTILYDQDANVTSYSYVTSGYDSKEETEFTGNMTADDFGSRWRLLDNGYKINIQDPHTDDETMSCLILNPQGDEILSVAVTVDNNLYVGRRGDEQHGEPVTYITVFHDGVIERMVDETAQQTEIYEKYYPGRKIPETTGGYNKNLSNHLKPLV